MQMRIRQMLMGLKMYAVNIKINQIMRKFIVIINTAYSYYINIISG